MWGASAFRRVGNKLYERGFPIYRPLYAAYKRYADRAEAVDQDGFVSRRCRPWTPAPTLEFTLDFSLVV